MTSVFADPSTVVTVIPHAPVTWADVAQRVADVAHDEGDRWAARHGLDVRRVGLTGRAYRDPRFDTLGGAR